MRTISEYLAKAEEFERLANTVSSYKLKRRYSNMAEAYRVMASERERLIVAGIVLPDNQTMD